jgi:hypothetical protein
VPLPPSITALRDRLQRLPGAGFLWLLHPRSALRAQGWFRSIRLGSPVDRGGKPIPWINYAAIALLAERVRPDFKVFEYGAGHSTLWWSERVARVCSCEHDAAWAASVRARLPPHAILFERPLGPSYVGCAVQAAKQYGPFDVLVIDGRDRVACARQCIDALRDGGCVVFDNTERGDYEPGCTHLQQHGFKRLDLHGMSPGVVVCTCTSIFYRADNCLGL